MRVMRIAHNLAITIAIVTVAVIALALLKRTVEHGPGPAAGTSTSTQSASTILGEVGEPATISRYIEVTESCGPYYEGTCLNVRSGPGTEYPSVLKIRTGAVLKVAGSLEREGHTWYRLAFDEWLRYPERVDGESFVAGEYVRVFEDGGTKNISSGVAPRTTKRIVVDRSEQKLYAYDGLELFMEEPISTGLELTPTPRGIFKIFKKTPSRYMQGPIPEVSDQFYDLPGVPWNLYFTAEGAVIHGAYWHDHFGEPWSHGCVNLPPQKAKELYEWADLGTEVVVRD